MLNSLNTFVYYQETDYLCQMHHLYGVDESEEALAEAARTSAHLEIIKYVIVCLFS